MTTATLHSTLERSRFTQHLLNALANLIPAARSHVPAAPAAPAATAQAASIEAQKVRQMAYSYAKTDPGFASDLYAAAARHEGLYAD